MEVTRYCLLAPCLRSKLSQVGFWGGFSPSGYSVILHGVNHHQYVGHVKGDEVHVSAGGWLGEIAKSPGGTAVASGAKKQIDGGGGSGILFGGLTTVALHELYHLKIGPASGDSSADPYSCEHLAIDRAVASDLCAAVFALRCDGEYADVPGVTPGDLFAAWCAEIANLNRKWEDGPGDKATACAGGGIEGAFDPQDAEDAANALGLSLPTPAEMAQDKKNAVPDCPCCTQTAEECCGM